MIQKFITYLTERGLKTATINSLVITFKSALRKAFTLKKINKMPTGIELPPIIEPKITVISDEQRQAIRNTKSRFKVCYLLALLGMRKTEIIGLTWDCVDLQEKRLYIKKIIKEDKHLEDGFYFDTPKTFNSIRTVYLTDEIVELMYEQIERQKKFKDNFKGEVFNKHNLVFTNSKGLHLYESSLLNNFLYLMKKNNLPQSRLHDCRHTFATDLIEANVNVATCILLTGHKDVRSLQRYLHPQEQTMIDAINSISNR